MRGAAAEALRRAALHVVSGRPSLSVSRALSGSAASAAAGAGGAAAAGGPPRTLAAVAAAGAAAAAWWGLGSTEGERRSVQFWISAFPIFLQYKAVEHGLAEGSAQQDAAFEALHETYAPVVDRLVTRLGGYYVKAAQFCSTFDDLVPRQYMEWCKRTQHARPVQLTAEQARAAVEGALGARLEDVFASWEEEPFGVASIGQVHRATLLDGRRVAVKVQQPGVEELFRADIATLKAFCKLAQPQHTPALEELEKTFDSEFDYRAEAESLHRVARNTNDNPRWRSLVRVPEPVMELSTRDVLVMEYLEGVKLDDGIRAQYAAYAERHGTTLEALEEEQKRKTRSGEVATRGSIQAARAERRAAMLLRSRDIVANVPRWLWNVSVAWAAPSLSVPYCKSELPINLGAVLGVLMAVTAQHIFVDGVFNADPHPGNILLLDDGRLGLIDFGQTKVIGPEEQLALAKAVVALARDDKEQVVRISAEELMIRTRDMLPEILYIITAFLFDRETRDIIGDRNLQQWGDWVEGTDPRVTAAQEAPVMEVLYSGERAEPPMHERLMQAARAVLLLRGLGKAFAIELRATEHWLDAAERVLRQHRTTYAARSPLAERYVAAAREAGVSLLPAS